MSSARPPRAHDIRGISTSLNYYSNLSLSNLMQVATWRSNRVFASRYLKEVSATQDNIQQFGPLVIAGDRLKPKTPQRKLGCSRSTLHSPRPSLSSNFSSFFHDWLFSFTSKSHFTLGEFILPYTDVIRCEVIINWSLFSHSSNLLIN